MNIHKKLSLILAALFVVLVLQAIPEGMRPSQRFENYDYSRWEDFYRNAARADSATGFDVQKYEIFLTINQQTQYINGNVIATVIAEENLSSIQYELENLTVSAVQVNGSPVAYTHQNGIINIPLSVSAGQTFETNVFYHGNPQLSPNVYQIGMYFTQNTVFTISDPDAGRYWWPCYDHPWDKAVVDLHIRMRSDWKVAANGIRQAIVDHGDGTSTTTWLGENPMTTYLVCITAGPYVELDQYLGDLHIQNFVMPNQYNNALVDLAQTPAMIEYFSEIFGAYPFEKYGHAVVSMSTFAAMEHQTMTTLGNFIINGTGAYELIIAHELAHQWFGNAVSFLDFPDVWLSEGFATYSEHFWVDKVLGWQAACNYILSSYHQYYLSYENSYGAQTVYNPSFNNYFTPPSYEKGASVLHMLRLKLGDAQFFELIQTWYETYKHLNATTAEFQAMAEQISGQDLEQFFQQWIYSPGIPSLEYAFYTKQNPPTLKVMGKSTSPTATQFYLDFPIQITHSAGTDSVLVQASPAGLTNLIPYANIEGITSISADPNNWVLLRGKSQMLPNLNECLGSNTIVLLGWESFINAESYNVYRRNSGASQWTLVNPDPITDLYYYDEDVVNGNTYEYIVKAIDAEGFESMASNLMSATPVLFHFNLNLLVIDETRDGTGAGISPTDEMVDEYYARVLEPFAFDTWDYESQGAPSLDLLGQYQMILWHDDDFANNHIIDNLQLLGGYLLGGGKLVISGWKTSSMLNEAWLDRFAGDVELYYDNSASLIRVESDVYPDLTPDPDKLNPVWNQMLPMIYTFENVQSPIYTAVMTDTSVGNGRSAAFIHEGSGTLAMFGFPLYFMDESSVRGMLQMLLPQLNPQLSQADDRIRDMARKLGFTYFSRGSFYFQQSDHEKAEAMLAMAQRYGQLAPDQARQAEEMLTASRFWIGKKRAEER